MTKAAVVAALLALPVLATSAHADTTTTEACVTQDDLANSYSLQT